MKDKDSQLIFEAWKYHHRGAVRYPEGDQEPDEKNINRLPSYGQVIDDHEQFSDIAYRVYGDMEEDELRLHLSVLEDLLEMDELSRREAQGQGPQRD